MTTQAKTTGPEFGYGEDEALLRDVARQLLDEKLPIERLRRLVAADHTSVYEHGKRPGWDAELWGEIVELGWTGLAIPASAGGAGLALVGIAGIVEEAGRHALPAPLVPTLNASYVLRAAGDGALPWLERIASGRSATLAITNAEGSWEPRDTGVAARAEGSDIVLDGSAHFVQDAFKVDLLVVSAKLADSTLLCVVPRETAGVSLEQEHIVDLTRDQATARFAGVRVPAAGIATRDGRAALERAWPALLVTVAADLCGTSEWQLQTTVEYAKQRKQFDRQIGFFQAVKHPLVDVMILTDRARSLLYHAASLVDAEDSDALTAARMAKSAASDAGAYASDRSVQLHGGIGFTWECDVHLFFKRSLHNQALFGDGVHQRRKLADVLIGPLPGAHT
jgi:alkylation response protein AidB-like acyl-CoA dehydrogenase